MDCRSYCDGPQLAPQLQHTAVCKSSAVHTITADLPPNKSSLPRLASLVRRILQHSDTSTKKAPRSAGFFAHVVARTADALTSQPLEVLLDDVAGLYDEMMSSAAGMGSFQEVGRTAGSERMPTCWPLVREAFRFVAKQVSLQPYPFLLPVPLHNPFSATRNSRLPFAYCEPMGWKTACWRLACAQA